MKKYNNKGIPLQQVSALTTDEVAVAIISDFKPKEKLVFVTYQGYVKRVAISEFNATRKTIDATKLVPNDKLLYVGHVSENQNIVLISQKQYCVCFECISVNCFKRNTFGIFGIKLDENDTLTSVIVAKNDDVINYRDKKILLSATKFGRKGSKGKLLT